MRIININQSFLFILALVLLNGCKAPEAYRAALDNFSHGSVLEISERFPEKDMNTGAELPGDFMFFDDLYQTSNTDNPIDTEKAFTLYYQEALANAETAIKGGKQLEKLNILDNAYAIKALILWRQKEYAAANEQALEAEPLLADNSSGQENDIRDLAMMQALPGLINIEKAYQALARQDELMKNLGPLSILGEDGRRAGYEEIKSLYMEFGVKDVDGAPSIKRGLALIERAIENVDGESAITLYLRNAQLAGMDTWGDMRVNMFKAARRLSVIAFSPEQDEWIGGEKQFYTKQRDSYLEELATLLRGGKNHKLYLYWAKVL